MNYLILQKHLILKEILSQPLFLLLCILLKLFEFLFELLFDFSQLFLLAAAKR